MRTRAIVLSLSVIAFQYATDARAQTPATPSTSTIRIGAAVSTQPTNDRYPEYTTPRSSGAAMPAPGQTVDAARSGQPTLAPPRPSTYPPVNSAPTSGAAALTAARTTPAPTATTSVGASTAPQTLPATTSAAPMNAAPPPFGSAPTPTPVPTNPVPTSPSATAPTPNYPAVSPLRTTPPAAASPAATSAGGTGRPGEKSLEGVQQPTLTIEKLAPNEIQVGKPAVFEIYVRNVGAGAAMNVRVHDAVPQGTRLLTTSPKAELNRQDELEWNLGMLRPGDEVKLMMELLPTTEGELGSVATISFSASASARTICTKPELVVDVQAPRSVLAGDDVPLRIKISNPGTGVATGVLITEVVPANMTHEAGAELEYVVGDLQPNESRELDLSLKAVKPGVVLNLLHAKGDGKLATEAKTQIEVVAPLLSVDVEGPKKRFLDRQATYTVSIANPGTAAARSVELATYLPRGLQFVDANNAGEYDPATHSVRWLLEELPAKERGTVTLTTIPVEPGQQVLRIESFAERGVKARKEEAVLIESAPSIVFQVVDTADPIEVGGETTYEVTVANQGSKEATNVVLAVTLPEGLKVLDAEGPTRFTTTGRSVQFQPLGQLAAKAETVYRVRAQCTAAGDHRCHVQLVSGDMKTPVTKEEGTRVYADE